MTRSILAAAALLAGTAIAPAQSPVVPETRFEGGDAVLANWLLIGPFPNEAPADGLQTTPRQGWDVDFLAPAGGESALDFNRLPEVLRLNPGASIRYAVSNSIGGVDLVESFGGVDEDFYFSLAYAFHRVVVDDAMTAHIWAGADDAAKFLVNGAIVHDEWVYGRGVRLGEIVMEIQLEAGENIIAIKSDNLTGKWGFHVRLADEERHAQLQEEAMYGSPGFTRFRFEGHEEDARALSQFLWRFWSERVGNFDAMFFQDYLTIADIYVNEALTPGTLQSIQDFKRNTFLTVRMEPNGHVEAQQHISTAMDGGWPFPLWPQMYGGWDGVTKGWHFQNSREAARQDLWVWMYNMVTAGQPWVGDQAAQRWRLDNAVSEGIIDEVFWRVRATGPNPALRTPEGARFRADNAPYMLLRWRRDGRTDHRFLPYMEWRRDGDEDFSPERRAYIWEDETYHSRHTGFTHSEILVAGHPLWNGEIVDIRLHLAPGEDDTTFEIDMFTTGYDNRHAVNNSILVNASWDYFRWTGDIAFLRQNINRLRTALRHEMTVMMGLELDHIRNTHHGHDGIAGWFWNEDGTKTANPGHGKGGNYWDLMPFGWDDAHHTMRYYAALLAMADIEEGIRAHRGWGIDTGALALDPEELRAHAADVKRTFNEKFWNPETGRFFGSFDINGVGYDYGFTFVNLDAIYFGIANEERAAALMEWISGERIVEGDTSTGEDIYHFQFGPRATTLRNIEWYGQGWTHPELLEFGEQIQDGGAVLGFTFYDLYARLRVLGPDNAWMRLQEILAWDRGVHAEGGYRAYYEARGIQLQGGGTAGGIGIDFEFLESSLPPAIVPFGFLGIDPGVDTIRIDPSIPSTVPEMEIVNMLLRNSVVDVAASQDRIRVRLHQDRLDALPVQPVGNWTLDGDPGPVFHLRAAGEYEFLRAGE